MSHEETIVIAAPAGDVYRLVADMPRMGEFSPENCGGEWLDGATGAVGDRFEGVNRMGDREWKVVCTVTAAEPGRVFQWVTGAVDDPYVRWTYRMEETAGSTSLTEVWDVESLPPTLAGSSDDRLAARAEMVRGAMRTTVEAIRSAAEA
jgi:hypothetical protein